MFLSTRLGSGKFLEKRIAALHQFKDLSAGPGDPIVFSGRALFCQCLLFRLPLGRDQTIGFHAAQGRINSAAGEPGCIHDVEAVAAATIYGLQNQGSRMRELRRIAHSYIASYTFYTRCRSSKVSCPFSSKITVLPSGTSSRRARCRSHRTAQLSAP